MINKYLQLRKFVQFSRRVIKLVLRRTPIIRKHYRLRSRIDCVTEACNLINKNYEAIDCHAINKRIERRLFWLGINFSQLPVKQKGDLHVLFADKPLHPSRYDELKNEMLEAPSELLKCRQWLNLHEMCCFRGRYTLAQIFREKARQLAIKPLYGKEFEPPISWERTIGAAIEGGECHLSEHLSELLQRAEITGDVANKLQLHLGVLNGQDISQEWVQRFDGSGFADYLAGKSIAIVGPAPTEALDADEIDSHDLVVRLNHTYEGKGTDPKHKGLRTDITCFSDQHARSFMVELDGMLPSEVSWGCFKSSSLASGFKEKNKDKCTRACITFHQLPFHGGYNMIPFTALDFALFKASSVKIFHTDLMLTIRRQKGYYPASFNRLDYIVNIDQTFRWSSILHDPVLQFKTLNSLWRHKKITGDSRFVEVMKMGLDAYLCELERVYAKPSAK